MSNCLKQSAKGLLSPRTSTDSSNEKLQLRLTDRKLTIQFSQQKPGIKQRVSRSLANLHNLKNNRRIEFEDFWSPKMKAQFKYYQKIHKTQTPENQEKPIPKPQEPVNVDILNIKSKINRQSSYYLTICSPRTCKVSIDEVGNIIGQCEEARKQVKKLSHRIVFDRRQLQRIF